MTLSGPRDWRLPYFAGIVKLLESPGKAGGLPNKNYSKYASWRSEVFNDLIFENIEIDLGKARLATVDLSEYKKSCSHLDISLHMTEKGKDHWAMYSFSALMPTDGFKHHLRCEDGLIINDFSTFIHGAKLYVDKLSPNEIRISCNEWINEGTGLSILVSLPHPKIKKDKEENIPYEKITEQ